MPEHRYKCGDIREDGMVFWSYRNDREYWVTPEGHASLRLRGNQSANRNRRPNPEKDFGWRLKQMYGITAEDYYLMLEDQGGLCAICHKAEINVFHGKVKKLCVDHCHETGKVRGLLCSKCNTAIGLFDENELRLQSATAYLRKHR